jgi:splicing factor 3A subunit 3
MEVLERQRNAHEDIERMEQAIVVRLAEEPRTKYDALLMEHQVAQFLSGIKQQADYLVESYRDETRYNPVGECTNIRARQTEIESMSGKTNEFDQFYLQLAEIKDIHRRHPNLPVEDLERNYRKRPRDETEDDRMSLYRDNLTIAISAMFTGEESWGRFLDIHTFHERFLNLRGVRTNISYIDYLRTFQGFRHLRRQTKNEEYLQYLIGLQEYLESFLKRVQPLVNHDKLMNSIGVDFERAWSEGTAPGQKEEAEATNGNGPTSPLFCEACQKTYAKETVFNAHLESKQHKKNVEKAKSEKVKVEEEDPEPAPGNMTREARKKEISRREFTILKLCQGEKLSVIIPATINNVERRSQLSGRERQKEIQQLQEEALNIQTDTVDVEENNAIGDDFIYNPLKLPLGWDGKPIPFWLYKLHGLGTEYSCEICGNMVYTGRKNFEKHFGEPTHIHGLKCLGIPNMPLFKEVTAIEEAIQCAFPF